MTEVVQRSGPLRRLFNVAALSALASFSLPASAYHIVGTASAQPASRFDEVCLVMDREASSGVALLALDPAIVAQSRLDEALALLRRARMYCRRSWVDPARVDYDALRRALPVEARHVQTLSDMSPSVRLWP